MFGSNHQNRESRKEGGMMSITLTKYETGWLRSGPVFGSGRAFRFRVGCLPAGEEAHINNFGAPNRDDWQILRIRNGVQGDWTGHFESADSALAELQQEIAADDGLKILVD
jgi:hypothetical protein